VVRKPTASAERDRFLALASADGAYTHTRDDRVNVHLHGLYRMFAAWMDNGVQRGAHLRGEEGVRSTRFHGEHNWIHLDVIDWGALPALIVDAKTIAAKRNAGRPAGKRDVYKPLAKAVDLAQKKPRMLHAGGPRAKVLSGERELAVAICKLCMARLAHLARDGEDIARLAALIDRGLRSEVWWPAANALPYGTEGAKKVIDAAESAALQMVRAVLGAQNSGSQSCMPYATKALLRAVRELEATESWDAACAFLVEVDELVMRSEFAAALAKYAKQAVPIDRVLWRGADAKGFPAWWLVRIGPATYGLLGKLGTRWTWIVDARDAVFATIPDEHFESGIEIAIERDAIHPAG
jgi:hypothetical protein